MSIQNLSPHGGSQQPLQQVWTMALLHGENPKVVGVIMALRSMVEATDPLDLPPANLVCFIHLHLFEYNNFVI